MRGWLKVRLFRWVGWIISSSWRAIVISGIVGWTGQRQSTSECAELRALHCIISSIKDAGDPGAEVVSMSSTAAASQMDIQEIHTQRELDDVTDRRGARISKIINPRPNICINFERIPLLARQPRISLRTRHPSTPCN